MTCKWVLHLPFECRNTWIFCQCIISTHWFHAVLMGFFCSFVIDVVYCPFPKKMLLEFVAVIAEVNFVRNCILGKTILVVEDDIKHSVFAGSHAWWPPPIMSQKSFSLPNVLTRQRCHDLRDSLKGRLLIYVFQHVLNESCNIWL